MGLDYEEILRLYEQEAKEYELELAESTEHMEPSSEDDFYQVGFYNGFSKAVYMLDRIYREQSEKVVEELFKQGRENV